MASNDIVEILDPVDFQRLADDKRTDWVAAYARYKESQDALVAVRVRMKMADPSVTGNDLFLAEANEKVAKEVTIAAEATWRKAARSIPMPLFAAEVVANALRNSPTFAGIDVVVGHRVTGKAPKSLPVVAVMPKAQGAYSIANGTTGEKVLDRNKEVPLTSSGDDSIDIRWIAGAWHSSPEQKQILAAIEHAPNVAYVSSVNGADTHWNVHLAVFEDVPLLLPDVPMWRLRDLGIVLGMDRHVGARVTDETTDKDGVTTRTLSVAGSCYGGNRASVDKRANEKIGRLLPGVGVFDSVAVTVGQADERSQYVPVAAVVMLKCRLSEEG